MEIKYIKLLFRLIVRGLIVYMVLFASTFGWAESHKENNQIDSQISYRLRSDVTFLSEEIGERSFRNIKGLRQTEDFIQNRFKDMGYVVQEMVYEIDGVEFKNIIATSPHFDEFKKSIIIGAHYDSCSNPGADDNASGIAGVLELANLFKNSPLNGRIKFIAFVNEEPPFFQTDNMGSRVYAKKAKEKGEKIKGVIILEMLGCYTDEKNSQRYPPFLGFFYPNKGNFIAMIGNYKSKKLVKNFFSNFRSQSKFPAEKLIGPSWIPGVGFSDHWSFWQEGYPAMMVTDTAFMRNPNYHKPTDLPNTLDFEKMAQVVLGLKFAIEEFSNE